MPHMDGFAVMRQLSPLIPDGNFVPILVLTADASLDTKRRALTDGATDFLTKPVDAIEVWLRVKNLLRTRLLQGHVCAWSPALGGPSLFGGEVV